MERRIPLQKCHVLLVSFTKVQYQPMLNTYEYHRMLLCLPGKNEYKNTRREDFLDDNNTVMTERGYAELL